MTSKFTKGIKSVDSEQSIVLEEISSPSSYSITSPEMIAFGHPIPAQQRVLLYSSSEWEEFITEWVHSQRQNYLKVLRLTGANDQGIDIAGLTDSLGLQGTWDNFQCKHYKAPLSPAEGLLEIGKILWHSYKKHYSPPRRYYFVAVRGCGMGLKRLLSNPEALKVKLINEWGKTCSEKITSLASIKLEGAFNDYVKSFDFSIFSCKEPLTIIDEHRATPYYALRFGGGLPQRPQVALPPIEPHQVESIYLQHLYDAYGDLKKTQIKDLESLGQWPDLIEHFHRQRESFYHAEALRNFARDTVPPGTYEELQNEVHAGVVDIQHLSHLNGFSCLTAVLNAVVSLQITANALISVIKTQDRKGICHQLTNQNRLRWKKL